MGSGGNRESIHVAHFRSYLHRMHIHTHTHTHMMKNVYMKMIDAVRSDQALASSVSGQAV